MQILIDNLSVEAINAALLRIQRSFKDNQASLTSNVNKIISNTSGVSSKYDDTALRNEISALQAILFQVQQSDENQNKRLDDHEEQIDQNVQNIAVLQNLMSNIKFEYDIDTNTITFTNPGGDKVEVLLKDTTYSFGWDSETHALSIVDNFTGETIFNQVVDTFYSFSWNNGVLTISDNRHDSPIAQISFDDRYYTESEIQTLILDLIPATASASNQLADKNWVNSSIETNTATFRGTYDSTSEISSVEGDNNDYLFVKTLDSETGLYTYTKYTWVAEGGDFGHWKYAYDLNTSGFTSDQLAAINSGITSTIVQNLLNGCYTGKTTHTLNTCDSWKSLLATKCGASATYCDSLDYFNTNVLANFCYGYLKANRYCFNDRVGFTNRSISGIYSAGNLGVASTCEMGICEFFCRIASCNKLRAGEKLTVNYGWSNSCSMRLNYPSGTSNCVSGWVVQFWPDTYSTDLWDNTKSGWWNIFAEINTLTSKRLFRIYKGSNTATCATVTEIKYACAANATNATNATNSTCFGGCTYTQACTNIRNGLVTTTDLNSCGYTTCEGTVTGVSLNGSSFTVDENGVASLTNFKPATAETADLATNATCFDGNTWSDAVTAIRPACTNTTTNALYPILLGTICNDCSGSLSEVYKNINMFANPSTGRLVTCQHRAECLLVSTLSESCTGFNSCKWIRMDLSTGVSNQLQINGPQNSQKGIYLSTEGGGNEYKNIALAIGSGNENRGLGHYSGGTFCWLQYWDCDNCERHTRPTEFFVNENGGGVTIRSKCDGTYVNTPSGASLTFTNCGNTQPLCLVYEDRDVYRVGNSLTLKSSQATPWFITPRLETDYIYNFGGCATCVMENCCPSITFVMRCIYCDTTWKACDRTICFCGCDGSIWANDVRRSSTAGFVYTCSLPSAQCNCETCRLYIKIKTGRTSRNVIGKTFRLSLYSMDATLNLDRSTNYYCGTYYGALKYSRCVYTEDNSNCFWLSYVGYRSPVLCSDDNFAVICCTKTTPSGVTFSCFCENVPSTVLTGVTLNGTSATVASNVATLNMTPFICRCGYKVCVGLGDKCSTEMTLPDEVYSKTYSTSGHNKYLLLGKVAISSGAVSALSLLLSTFGNNDCFNVHNTLIEVTSGSSANALCVKGWTDVDLACTCDNCLSIVVTKDTTAGYWNIYACSKYTYQTYSLRRLKGFGVWEIDMSTDASAVTGTVCFDSTVDADKYKISYIKDSNIFCASRICRNAVSTGTFPVLLTGGSTSLGCACVNVSSACPLTFNAATGVLSAASFSGDVSGHACIYRCQATSGTCYLTMTGGTSAGDITGIWVPKENYATFQPANGLLYTPGLCSGYACTQVLCTAFSMTCGNIYYIKIGSISACDGRCGMNDLLISARGTNVVDKVRVQWGSSASNNAAGQDIISIDKNSYSSCNKYGIVGFGWVSEGANWNCKNWLYLAVRGGGSSAANICIGLERVHLNGWATVSVTENNATHWFQCTTTAPSWTCYICLKCSSGSAYGSLNYHWDNMINDHYCSLKGTGFALCDNNLGNVTTISAYKNDNSGSKTVTLMYDITSWYNGSTSVAGVGFVGSLYATRISGYTMSYMANIAMVASYGRNGAALTNGATLQLYYQRTSGNTMLHYPVIIKDSRCSTNVKYWLAMLNQGSGHDFVMIGQSWGTRYREEILYSTGTGSALPAGVEILMEAEPYYLYAGNWVSCTDSVVGKPGVQISPAGQIVMKGTSAPEILLYHNNACSFSTGIRQDTVGSLALIARNNTGCCASTEAYCFCFCSNGYMYGNVCGNASTADSSTYTDCALVSLTNKDSSRPTDANCEGFVDTCHRGAMNIFLATSCMVNNKPAMDSYITQWNWDSCCYKAQMAIPTNPVNTIQMRFKCAGTWGSWNNMGCYIGTVKNSTCFGGCTYSDACTNIRSGLCSHDCLVKHTALTSTSAACDRNILVMGAGFVDGCVCPVYFNNVSGKAITYNSCCGLLKIGPIAAKTSASATASSGLLLGLGYIELSACTPYIDFHRNHACQDYSSRIIDGSNGLCITVNNATACSASTTSCTFCFLPTGVFKSPYDICSPYIRATNSIEALNFYNMTQLHGTQPAEATCCPNIIFDLRCRYNSGTSASPVWSLCDRCIVMCGCDGGLYADHRGCTHLNWHGIVTCQCNYSLTANTIYYIKVGRLVDGFMTGTTELDIMASGSSLVDKVNIKWLGGCANAAGTVDGIEINATNYAPLKGLLGIGWVKTADAWNCANDIYIKVCAPATATYCFGLNRTLLGCAGSAWTTGFSCTTTAPAFTCFVCTKPNGARAFHWLNGDTYIESMQDWKLLGSFTGTRSCNRYYMRLGSFHNVNPEACIKVVLSDASHCSSVYISTKGTCLTCGNWTYQIENEGNDFILADTLQLQCNSTDTNAYLGILDSCSTGTICMSIYQKGNDLGFNPLASTTSRYTNTLSGYSPIAIVGKNLYGYTNFNNINANRVDSYVFTTTSALKCKCDITKPSRCALDIIDSLDIVEYRYKNEDKSEPKHIGIIADYTDELLSGKTRDQLRLADAIGLLLQAVKELRKEERK